MSGTETTRRGTLQTVVRWFGIPVVLAVAIALPVAHATEGETYPAVDSQAIEDLVDAFRAVIPDTAPVTSCGPTAVTSGTQSWRKFNDSISAASGPYHALSTFPKLKTSVPLITESHAVEGVAASGGDTDDIGNDSYMIVRLVGIRASLFLVVKMEAEDGDVVEWKIRYLGQGQVTVTASTTVRADQVRIENVWDYGYTYVAKDFDSIQDNDFSEDKWILQKFKFVLQLIDGKSTAGGHSIEVKKPQSTVESFTFGVKASTSASTGSDGTSTTDGMELGFGWTSADSYKNWKTDGDTESAPADNPQDPPSVPKRTVVVDSDAPCPSKKQWWCNTFFDGEFVIRDYTGSLLGLGSGDQGSRQDLQLSIHNYISKIEITQCHACEEPQDPPVEEPQDPTPQSGGNAPVITPDPSGPPVTPKEKRIVGFRSGNGLRDLTGDGERNELLGGQMSPDLGNWCGTPPFFLGVAHRPLGAVASDGYDRVDRWSIGDADDDRMSAALVDPWDTQDGRRALVVLKNVDTGNCRLSLVLRDATATTTGTEAWPDRSAAMPVDGYTTTVVDSVDLSVLFSSDDVAGALLREVELENNDREVWVVPLLVHVLENDENSSTYDGEAPGQGYKVTVDPVTGDLVLDALVYGNADDPSEDDD